MAETELVCKDLLHRLVEMARKVLGENLVGVYLHGSAALKCFQPEKSDLDLLVIVRDQVSDEAKAAFMENVVELNKEAPAKGLELSLVKRGFCNPFVYPTPFELHFSPVHLEWYHKSPKDYIEKMQGTDKDLAAHFMITVSCGICLWGEAIAKVFGPVPPEAYRDSILEDVQNALEDILENPLYVTLNLCRVLGYLRGIDSVEEVRWRVGLKTLPSGFQGLIRDALQSYETGGEMCSDKETELKFAGYMLAEIRKSEYIK